MTNRWFLVVIAIGLLSTAGCATKKYVQEQMDASETRTGQRIDQVEGQVETNQTQIESHSKTIAEQQEALEKASGTAREALDRAVAAGKLAEGKFLYETTFTEDEIRFDFDRAGLNDQAKAALDEFASKVKADNENVFIEIQGHTDSIGSESYNNRLGLERAEQVRRYLSSAQGFPLHRMSVISYGETQPVADNSSREARSQNRRVVIVVLK